MDSSECHTTGLLRHRFLFALAVAGSRSPVAVPQSSPVGLPPVAEQEKDDFSLYHAFGSDENLDLVCTTTRLPMCQCRGLAYL